MNERGMKARATGAAVAAFFAIAATIGPTQAAAASASHRGTLPAVATAITPNGSWPVYHHDDGHTGYDGTQPTAVTATTGWTSSALDQSVYAEPLVYQGIVYVATLNNTVYALNQTDGSLVWSNHLGAPETGGWTCGNVSPQGILGTPVIDPSTGRIYVATLGLDNVPRLEGLDLATGLETMTTPITTPTPGFDWRIEQQRGALAVRNGYVYVPFGGRAGDCGTYHGYVYAVPTNATAVTYFYATPGAGAGFWTAGGVVVDDSTGRVFDTSGNGVSTGCSANGNGTPVYENDAVVRLSATLAHEDAFIPSDWQGSWCNNDQDLGSASMVLISPTLAFQSGKWGNGFLVNPQALGGLDGQRYPTPSPATYSPVDVCFGSHSDANFGSYAYAAPYVYLSCDPNSGIGFTGRVVALKVDTAAPSFSSCDSTCGAPSWAAGATGFGPPIVAGSAVWAVATNGGGLYGFDAATGAQIYHSSGFGATHFTTPSEAGGQIFVGSGNVVRSFNLVTGCRSVTISANPVSMDTVGNTVTLTGAASGCPNANPSYEFWTLAPGASSWQLGQAYSTSTTFNWSTTTLSQGTYGLIVWARDANSAGAYGNGLGRWDTYAQSSYVLTAGGSPCPSAGISAAPPSPAAAGTIVGVTGQSAGCPNPLYEFWTLAPGAPSWQLGQAYSTSPTFNWNTTGLAAGTYGLALWVRDSSSAGAYGNGSGRWDTYGLMQYAVTSGTPTCASAGISTAPPSTAQAGITVVVTGHSTACPNPLYEFWTLAPGAPAWNLAQAYSTSAVFNWNTTGLAPGAYGLTVWARDSSSSGASGNGLGRWDAYSTTQYSVTTTACSSVGATESPMSSATSGTTVTVTATAVGCPHPQYQFWTLAPGASSWQLAQAYSAGGTFLWHTTGLVAGTYQVAVWARDGASAGTYSNGLGSWDAYSIFTYRLT
jgi:PQQ-like domain